MIVLAIGALCLVLAAFSLILLGIAIYQDVEEAFLELMIALPIFLLGAIVAFK